ncbi:MAG: tetratricopeptide repeat protein [Candidatus Nomurabacteria bacterium]|nr:MAG: tetratricopeptide repeat protein [Candidatus Nomurabacteria bacterium]
MEENIFLPKQANLNKDDVGSNWLQTMARFIFILTIGLLPIFFIPNVYIALGFTKTYFVIVGIFAALILFGVSILRRTEVRFSLPATLVLFWLFVLISLASALLSGDRTDAIYGNILEVHTVGFFVLLGVILTITIVFGEKMSAIARLFIVSIFSTLALLASHLIRLMAGPDVLSFGLFTSSADSWLGSFNDLAIYAGMVILVTLLVVQRINLTTLAKSLASAVLFLSLLFLAIVNFSVVWLIVGLFSLFILLYLLSKDTWLRRENESSHFVPKAAFFMTGAVVVVSFVFIIGGSYLGVKINNLSNINYLEVRPSVGATVDIIGSVYSQDAFLGVGPNRFDDAWRLHRDPVINQTNFWNTDFAAGNGFVPTLFATTGVAGGMAFVIFLLSFLYIGYRLFFSPNLEKLDRNWFTVGLVTFFTAIYLWLMTIVYVPGVVIMILAIVMTGLTLSVYKVSVPNKDIVIDVVNKRRYGVVLMVLVLVVIVVSSSLLFKVTKQYLAQVNYADAVRSAESIGQMDAMLQHSQDLFAQDLFVAERAKLRLGELYRLLAIPEPTEEDIQVFQGTLVEGINMAEQAILLDSTNPVNYALLGSFYGLLDPSETEELVKRRDGSFKQAQSLDPINPSYSVLWAQLAARQGDYNTARQQLGDAIQLKNNYTEALFLLSQIDILEKKTDNAIAVTKSIINIEPYNPTRYFQLGVLLTTAGEAEKAAEAFKQAIALDNNYANARYFLALNYLDAGRKDEALEQLRIVEITNQDNSELKAMIKSIEAGEFEGVTPGFTVPVNDGKVVETQGEVTTASEVPETDLVTPLNQTVEPTEGGVVSETE